MLSELLGSVFGRRQVQRPKVYITTVNLKFMGGTHSLNGMHVPSEVFDYPIPFSNKMGSDKLPNEIVGPKITISKITVSEPFSLVEVNPSLPVDVQYMSKVDFMLKIRAPSVTYDGPMAINFGNDSTSNIAINISKVLLTRSGKSVDLENSELVATMQKSQVFRKDIQLYKIMSLNDSVNNIEISKPFELVSVTPNLPITADRKDSYIISLFIKAPQSSFSGDLEIKLS